MLDVKKLGQQYDMISQLGNKYDKSQKPKSGTGLLSKLSDITNTYAQEDKLAREGSNAFHLGGAQQIGEMGANALNLIPGVNIPYPSLKQYVSEENNPLFTAGRIGYGVPAELLAYRLTGKIPGAGTGTLSQIGRAMGVGGATGGETIHERAIAAVLAGLFPIGGTAKTGLEHVKKATTLAERSAAISGQEGFLEAALKGSKETTKEKEKQLAAQIANEADLAQTSFEEGGKKFKQKLPQEEEKNINALSNELKIARKEIEQTNTKNYDKFKTDAKGGKIKVKEHAIPIKSLQHDIAEIEEIASPKLKEVIENSIGKTTKIKSPHPDLPEQTYHQQANATVNDYMRLWKTARDEARMLYEEAISNPSLSAAQKETKLMQAQKLRKLSKDAETAIHKTLPSSKRIEYKNMQHFFEHHVLPWRESNLLKKATEHHPQIKTKSFMESLIRENKPALKSYLLDRHPKVKKAIANHDLMDLDITNPKAIEEALKGDKGKALPKDIREDLHSMLRDSQEKDISEKLLKHVTTEDLKLVQKTPEINKLLKKKPHLGHPFASVREQRAQTKEIKKELEAVGMTKQEIEEELKNHSKYMRAATNVMTVFFGHRVSKVGKGLSDLSNLNLKSTQPKRGNQK